MEELREQLERLEAELDKMSRGRWRADANGVWCGSDKVANPPRLTDHRASGGPADAVGIARLHNLAAALLRIAKTSVAWKHEPFADPERGYTTAGWIAREREWREAVDALAPALAEEYEQVPDE